MRVLYIHLAAAVAGVLVACRDAEMLGGTL